MQRTYVIEVESAFVSLGGSKYVSHHRTADNARDAVKTIRVGSADEIVRVMVESTGEVVPKKLWTSKDG